MKKSQFVFRPKGDIGVADDRDRSHKLGPNHGQGGNDVSHYLGKTLGPNTLYPISQTLPQDDAAVLACETAIAGDRFFVPDKLRARGRRVQERREEDEAPPGLGLRLPRQAPGRQMGGGSHARRLGSATHADARAVTNRCQLGLTSSTSRSRRSSSA